MSDKSKIEWTEATWNPWYGCIKISPGCKNCYMYREMERYGRDPKVVTRSKTKFNDPLLWVKRGQPPKFCFTCSWSDFFIESADAWRPEAWGIIRQTPQITYQILTKRPELIRDRLPADWGDGYENVWLGTSVESRKYVRRITELTKIKARVLWVSAEPLLDDLSLRWLSVFHENAPYIAQRKGPSTDHLDGLRRLHWIVVGGESGPECRPMEAAWAREIAAQCKEAGVPFFMKQMGGKADKRGDLADIPEDLHIRQYPVAGGERA